jgi:hypothetical protein
MSAMLQGVWEAHVLCFSPSRPTTQVSGACELAIPNMRVHSCYMPIAHIRTQHGERC